MEKYWKKNAKMSLKKINKNKTKKNLKNLIYIYINKTRKTKYKKKRGRHSLLF